MEALPAQTAAAKWRTVTQHAYSDLQKPIIQYTKWAVGKVYGLFRFFTALLLQCGELVLANRSVIHYNFVTSKLGGERNI